MLAASGSAPNQTRERANAGARPAPRPDNWKGVDQGLAAARRAFREGAAEECEAILREVLEFAPAEARAWAWLGKTLEHLGRGDEARDCYARASRLLDQRPERADAPPASPALARLLWQQGERKAARAMLGVLLLRDPDDPRLQELKRAWEAGE